MTTKETKDLIDAYKAALKAKDQTIVLLADMVDELRKTPHPEPMVFGRHVPHDDTPEAWDEAAAAAAQLEGREKFVPSPHGTGEKMWLDDDEEDLAAAFEAGEIDTDQFEQALAQVQAFNTTIEVAR